MSQPKLIATLLRSIADLLEDEPKRFIGHDIAEPGGDYSVTTILGSPGNALMKEAAEMMKAEERESLRKLDTRLSYAIPKEKSECKTCTNGGKGRHRNDCPRGHGPVVEHAPEKPETDPGDEVEEDDGMDTAKKRVDEINASEVKHACCGSKGWRHKAGCAHGGSSFPEKVGSKFGDDAELMEEPEKNPDLKTFECEACGKRFQAEPDYVKCSCGSDEICWPIE